MKRILVGVDGSNESKAAAAWAARLAQATQSAIELAHVLPAIADATTDGNLMTRRWQTDRTEHARMLLSDLSQSTKALEVGTALLEGSPAHRLAEEARRDEIWLVVVGHRGRGAVERTLLGSVADRLAQISPKPVLVVR